MVQNYILIEYSNWILSLTLYIYIYIYINSISPFFFFVPRALRESERLHTYIKILFAPFIFLWVNKKKKSITHTYYLFTLAFCFLGFLEYLGIMLLMHTHQTQNCKLPVSNSESPKSNPSIQRQRQKQRQQPQTNSNCP